MKCKRCGTDKGEIRPAPIIGDWLCKKCDDELGENLKAFGVVDTYDTETWIEHHYAEFMRGSK